MAGKSENSALDLRQVGVVTRYELLKHLRRRRLLAVLAIAASIGVLLIALPYLLNVHLPDQAQVWASTFFSFAGTLAVIVGAFFAGDAISSEFEHRTGYILFPNPVRRASLVLGKFMAAFLSGVLPLVIYYAFGIGDLLWIYRTVPWEVGVSLLYALLYLCCVLGLTFLFSALLKSSMAATLLSFFTFILIFSVVSQVITLGGIEPWFLPNYAGGMITQVIYPQKDTVIQVPGSPFRFYQFYPKFPISIFVLAAYFVGALVLSTVITNRKEMA